MGQVVVSTYRSLALAARPPTARWARSPPRVGLATSRWSELPLDVSGLSSHPWVGGVRLARSLGSLLDHQWRSGGGLDLPLAGARCSTIYRSPLVDRPSVVLGPKPVGGRAANEVSGSVETPLPQGRDNRYPPWSRVVVSTDRSLALAARPPTLGSADPRPSVGVGPETTRGSSSERSEWIVETPLPQGRDNRGRDGACLD